MSASPTIPLLRVRDLVTSFQTPRGAVRSVDRVSFDIYEGQTLGIVGESGCGKSVTALSILRLVSSPGNVEGGRIELRGKNLLDLSEREMQDVRGNEISMIFQEPMTSLNPVYTVGSQIVEAIRLHQKKTRSQAHQRSVELLRLVGIPDAATNVDAYPHQLSGGMRQRVMIAMALACEPSLLIADEPTTALDVTIQAQILSLLSSLQQSMKTAVMLITHDLSVLAERADRVLVMYAGSVVEDADVQQLFERPRHPYTQGLLRSMPSFTPETDLASHVAPSGVAKRPRLPVIEGMVPDLFDLPLGCRFADRCTLAVSACRAAEPELRALPGDGDSHHLTRCIRAEEL